jgi:uncharacterized protein involved in exopolysaccharide biosynthesis
VTANNLPPNDPGKIDFAAFFAVMRRYKYLVVATGIGCAVIAAIIAFLTVPVFRAEMAITEATHDELTGGAGQLGSQLGGIASLVGMNLGPQGVKSREYQGVLRSRDVVEEFVKRYDLLPKLYPPPAIPRSLWFGVKKFQGSVLSIRDDKRSGLTIVDINWTDPVIAARWANDFVALANEVLSMRAVNEAKASIDYLNDQIAHTSDLEMHRVMYNLIENETKTLTLAHAAPEYAFTVVDRATPPEQRSSPHRTLMTGFGFLLGLLLGALMALWRNSKVTARQYARDNNGH